MEGGTFMNIQKFTQKSIEAVNDCEKLAYEYGNQEIEQEHLLVALLHQQPDSEIDRKDGYPAGAFYK